MDISKFWDGKLTVRGCAAAFASGAYLMAYQVGELMEVESNTIRDIIAATLQSDGFKLALIAVIGYGIRRAIAKGGTLESPTPETPEEQEQSTQALLKQLIQQIEKGNPK